MSSLFSSLKAGGKLAQSLEPPESTGKEKRPNAYALDLSLRRRLPRDEKPFTANPTMPLLVWKGVLGISIFICIIGFCRYFRLYTNTPAIGVELLGITNFGHEYGIMSSMETPAVASRSHSETAIIVPNRKPNTNIGDVPKIVEEFRQFYLQQRNAGRYDYKGIFREFRKDKEINQNIWFNPYPNMLDILYRRWEGELPMTMRKITVKKKTVAKKGVDDTATVLKEIAYHTLEDGAKNLQSLLIDDASKLIQESNVEFQAIDDNGGMWRKDDYERIRLAKKKVALSIASDVLKGAHRFELIKIKKNAEGRETASFMMDLVRRSTAGEIGDEEMAVLENATS